VHSCCSPQHYIASHLRGRCTWPMHLSHSSCTQETYSDDHHREPVSVERSERRKTIRSDDERKPDLAHLGRTLGTLRAARMAASLASSMRNASVRRTSRTFLAPIDNATSTTAMCFAQLRRPLRGFGAAVMLASSTPSVSDAAAR
jgi:hypothetical protein